MFDLEEHFEELGLAPGASMEEIKQAYRDLARVWHPDRFAGDKRLQRVAEEKLKRINEAYKAVSGRTGTDSTAGRRARASAPPRPAWRPESTTEPPPPPGQRTAADPTEEPRSFREPAAPVSPLERLRRGIERRPVLATLSVGAFSLVAVLLVGLIRLSQMPNAPSLPAVAPPADEVAEVPEEDATPPAGAAIDAPASRASPVRRGSGVPFGIKATREEVRTSMGLPTRVERNVWWYGADRVVFSGGLVVGYSNPSGTLPIQVEEMDLEDAGPLPPDIIVEEQRPRPAIPEPEEEDEDDWWWPWE